MIQPGSRLAHYEIISALGKGGMGEVYRARDTKLGRQVAIKVLPSEFSRDEERLARLDREARMLAALNHFNIAAIYGLEQSDDSRFLVLELVEGDTLADRLKRGAIPVEEALRIALQIAEALEAAHEKGIVHRDLKPQNIKITPTGKVKILDFGLAKALAGDSEDLNLSNSPTISMAATQQGVILGTAAYMSPEQARGEDADHRADVWAFGVVLFEMLTGQSTFDGKTTSDVLASVLKTEPSWRNLPGNLHPRIRSLLERCLEKEARNRYSGIADARVDIEKALADPAGVIVQAAAEPSQALSRSRLPWIAATVVGIVIAGLAGWYLKPGGSRQVVRFDYEISEGQDFGRTVQRKIDISPDGTRVAYAAQGGAQGLHLLNLEQGDSVSIQGTEERVSNPTFSPDSQRIAYIDRGANEFRNISIAGGAATTVISVEEDEEERDLSWPSDDTVLLVLEEGIMEVPANGGMPELLLSVDEGEQIDNPQILPNESVLFTSTRGDATRIIVASLETKERTELPVIGIGARYVSTGHVVYVFESDLWAVGFDLDTLTVASGPAMIEPGVSNGDRQASYSVSDTGTLVYIPGAASTRSPSNRTLLMLERDGEMMSLTQELRSYERPRASPDGDRIAVEVSEPGGDGATHIYIVNVETGIGNPLTIEGTENISAVWTNDGQTIVYASDQGETGTLDLYKKSANGTGRAELVFATEGDLIPTDMLPGGVLLYTKVGTSLDIFTLDLSDENAEPAPFVVTDDNESEAQASPDGRWVAFTSDRSGMSAIWALAYPLTGDDPRLVSDGGGVDPSWSIEQDEIYFVKLGEGVWAASVQTSPSFSRGTIEPLNFVGGLFGTDFGLMRPYDRIRTADGERFLFVRPEFVEEGSDQQEPTQPKINVVLNWFEVLNERVPVD